MNGRFRRVLGRIEHGVGEYLSHFPHRRVAFVDDQSEVGLREDAGPTLRFSVRFPVLAVRLRVLPIALAAKRRWHDACAARRRNTFTDVDCRRHQCYFQIATDEHEFENPDAKNLFSPAIRSRFSYHF